MNGNIPASKRAGVVGAIDPDAYAAGTYTTGWVDMSKFGCLLALIAVGTMASTSTVNAKIEQATSSGGAGAKDVTGLAITALTEAGADSDKQALINVMQGDLDRNNGFRYVRLSMTVGTAASDAGGFLLGFDAVKGDADANDATTVDEIVS